MGVLTEDLIQSIINRTLLPVSAKTFDNDQILEMASEELSTRMVPMLLSTRENFFLKYVRQSVVAGKARYTIPSRAIGVALKDFWFIDQNGYRMNFIPQTDTRRLGDFTFQQGNPIQFMLEGDEVLMLPTPNRSVGSLEMWYFRRPSALIVTTSCAKVTGFTVGLSTVVFDVDTDLTESLPAGSLVDLQSAVSPYLTWADDVEIVAITASTIEVAKTNLIDEAGNFEVQIGDYICPAGFSCIPTIPLELHSVLAQSTACAILQSLSHIDKLQIASARLDQMIEATSKLIANRVEAQLQVIRQQNGISSAAEGGVFWGNGNSWWGS